MSTVEKIGEKLDVNIMKINGMIIRRVIIKIKEMCIIKPNFNKIKKHIKEKYGIEESVFY